MAGCVARLVCGLTGGAAGFGWMAIGDGAVLVGAYRYHSVCIYGNGSGLVYVVGCYVCVVGAGI